jgi:hypothetical protein
VDGKAGGGASPDAIAEAVPLAVAETFNVSQSIAIAEVA